MQLKRSTKLNRTIKELIEKHYDEIRKNVYCRATNATAGSSKNITQNVAEAVLEQLVDVAIEYKPLVDKIGFVQYATTRCWMRYIDRERRTQLGRKVRGNYAKLKEAKDFLFKKNGFVDEESLKQELRRRGIVKVDKIMSPQERIEPFQPSIHLSSKKQISQWKDVKQAILNHLRDLSKMEKKIVVEYLLPLAEGRPHKTPGEIAKDLSVPVAKFSSILREGIMHDLIKRIVSGERSN